MSKLLMHLTEKKEVDTFVSVFNEINQDMKTADKDLNYSIKKGNFINFKSGIMKVHSCFNKNERTIKKCPNIEEIMSYLNGCLNGNSFFQWLKDNKKYIDGIKLYNDHFVVTTQIPEVEFKSEDLIQDDITAYMKMKKRFTKKVAKKQISEEFYNKMKETRVSHTLDIKGYKIIMTFKLFLGMKAKSECFITIQEINEKENLYCAVLSINGGNHINRMYYPFIKY